MLHRANKPIVLNSYIQILEELPEDGYKNGAIYQYHLEREDYWIKKLYYTIVNHKILSI